MSNSSTALNHPRGHDASPHGTQPSSQVHVDVVVEDDPHYVPPFGKDTHGHALYSALVTLTLGVLGRWVVGSLVLQLLNRSTCTPATALPLPLPL